MASSELQAGGSFTHNRWYTSLFYDGPSGSAFSGLDTGFIVHYIGQYWDDKYLNHLTARIRSQDSGMDY